MRAGVREITRVRVNKRVGDGTEEIELGAFRGGGRGIKSLVLMDGISGHGSQASQGALTIRP